MFALLIPVILGAAVIAGADAQTSTTPGGKPGESHLQSHSEPVAAAKAAKPTEETKTATTASTSASTKALQAANHKMHAQMDIAYTGNADVDFIRGMIPHHQGAIDTAKIVLKYGSDPMVLQLAQDIVGAQTAEIEYMRAWLKERGLKE